MYFRVKNGSYKRVPQMVNLGLKGQGGVTVYYIPPYDGRTKVTAFKPVSFISLFCHLLYAGRGALEWYLSLNTCFKTPAL